jgi:hypothetical protein
VSDKLESSKAKAKPKMQQRKNAQKRTEPHPGHPNLGIGGMTIC